MCDNKQALIKIEKLCDELKSDKIDFVEFINEFEIVCYNDISSRNLDYFADGWSKATVSSFMKVCLRAFVDEDEMSQSRLIVDLGIDDVDFEVNIMSENFVEFECISKVDSEIRIAGYIDITSVDDDEPDMYFYNQQGLECGSYVPSNPFEENSEDWNAYEELSYSFQSDEMFMQFLADFSDENKTVDRGDYLLKINDGGVNDVD